MEYHYLSTVVPVLQYDAEENSVSITAKLNVYRSTSPTVRDIADSLSILLVLFCNRHKTKACVNHVVVVCHTVRLRKK